MQNVISLDTEKLARRGFQHEGPPLPTRWRNTGGGLGSPPSPNAYELFKTPSHILVRSQYCGIVWMKEERCWRELEMCASPKVGAGAEISFGPSSWKGGGASTPLLPLFLRLWVILLCDLSQIRSAPVHL